MLTTTCLITSDNLKGTNPYMIFIGLEINRKDIRSLSIYYIPVDSYTCKIKD